MFPVFGGISMALMIKAAKRLPSRGTGHQASPPTMPPICSHRNHVAQLTGPGTECASVSPSFVPYDSLFLHFPAGGNMAASKPQLVLAPLECCPTCGTGPRRPTCPIPCCMQRCVLDAHIFRVSLVYEPWTTRATETDNVIKAVFSSLSPI